MPIPCRLKTDMRKGDSLRKTFGRRQSLRLPGFDYHPSYIYHLIWGTYRRKPSLSRSALTVKLVDLLTEEVKGQVRIYAYCFMPDHVHLLVSGIDPRKFAQRYKGRSTRIYWETGGVGKLWQRGFYDHVLRKEEDVKQLARYILGNPVRKGLVEDYRGYPFSGSFEFDKEAL